MTPKTFKRAFKLYKAYKTTDQEYLEIAEQHGIQATTLNQMCSRHRSIKMGFKIR